MNTNVVAVTSVRVAALFRTNQFSSVYVIKRTQVHRKNNLQCITPKKTGFDLYQSRQISQYPIFDQWNCNNLDIWKKTY